MHSDLHSDLDNLDSVENNLRHSAKGSNDAYDVFFSLTHCASAISGVSPAVFNVSVVEFFAPASVVS